MYHHLLRLVCHLQARGLLKVLRRAQREREQGEQREKLMAWHWMLHESQCRWSLAPVKCPASPADDELEQG